MADMTEQTFEAAPGEPAGAVVPDELARARALVASADRARIEACDRELREVLARHGMTLEALGVLNLKPIGG